MVKRLLGISERYSFRQLRINKCHGGCMDLFVNEMNIGYMMNIGYELVCTGITQAKPGIIKQYTRSRQTVQLRSTMNVISKYRAKNLWNTATTLKRKH
jgi:hypothetical protein